MKDALLFFALGFAFEMEEEVLSFEKVTSPISGKLSKCTLLMMMLSFGGVMDRDEEFEKDFSTNLQSESSVIIEQVECLMG
mmetsp:Transcript_6256/g.8710  ORF Transcript_6256/g.8710 Transcript_6256/m.8710 type:complete len:81 (-) Transcript_6256:123-365(-)